MISTIPRDHALPHLQALLDGASALTLLSDHLERQSNVELLSCHPKYIRYKPETSCLVQYDLTLRDRNGVVTTVGAYLKIFLDDRAARRAESEKMQRLVQQANHLGDELPLPRVTYIPELNGLLQFYPVDYDLRFMAQAASAESMTEVVRKGLRNENAAVTFEPELIRYKPARKALYRYRVENAPVSTVYGKVQSDNRVERLAAQTKELIKSGVATPPVLFVLAKYGFIAHDEAPGTQLASLRGTEGYASLMAPLADVLRHFQSVEVPDAIPHRLTDEATAIRHSATFLGTIVPDLAPRLNRLSENIANRLSRVTDVLTTSHGDFYDDQAMVSDNGINIIDLDELRLSHPLLDVGNMLAHLGSGKLRGEDLDAAHGAFLAASLQGTRFNEADVAVFEAAGLLKLAPGPFRRLEPNWAERIERILALAEQTLGAHRSPEDTSAPAPVTDPALPQLDTLQNAAAMSERLAVALRDDSVSVTDATVVRHKPGRRAIMRYDLGTGERLFGKTFASRRGPKVYEITKQITESRAFGPMVALPDPVAYLADLKLLLQRSVPGSSVESALLAGDITLAERIATTLHRFHHSDLDLGRRHDLEKELSPLALRTEQVADHTPALRDLAQSCLARITSRGVEEFRWRDRPVHRDFYHDQLLIHEGQLAVLDLDDAAMSEPLVDVANFAAHLTLLAAQRPKSAPALNRAREAFVAQYRHLDREFDPVLFDFLTATTLLRLAGIHVSRTNGDAVAEALLHESAHALDAIEHLTQASA